MVGRHVVSVFCGFLMKSRGGPDQVLPRKTLLFLGMRFCEKPMTPTLGWKVRISLVGVLVPSRFSSGMVQLTGQLWLRDGISLALSWSLDALVTSVRMAVPGFVRKTWETIHPSLHPWPTANHRVHDKRPSWSSSTTGGHGEENGLRRLPVMGHGRERWGVHGE